VIAFKNDAAKNEICEDVTVLC